MVQTNIYPRVQINKNNFTPYKLSIFLDEKKEPWEVLYMILCQFIKISKCLNENR